MICPDCSGRGWTPYNLHNPLGLKREKKIIGFALGKRECKRCKSTGEI
jgi:hypothetical protein